MSRANDPMTSGLTSSAHHTEALKTHLVEMAVLASNMLADALKSIKKSQYELARDLNKRDQQLNALEIQINLDTEATLSESYDSPETARRAISAISIAADLERIGDLAKGLGKRGAKLEQQKSTKSKSLKNKQAKFIKSVTRMGKPVKKQMKQLIGFLKHPKLENIDKILEYSEDVSDMYDSLFRELLTYMIEDPRHISICTHLLFMAKNIERISDHIRNICEHLYLAQTGQALPSRTASIQAED